VTLVFSGGYFADAAAEKIPSATSAATASASTSDLRSMFILLALSG
jgi:hypothetical protein